jgi:shikimate dehydrogenase
MKSLKNINLAETEVVGLFGYPVEHSLSPIMHNTAFSELGINYFYLPFEVKPEELSSAITAIKALNLRGVNLTIPHKESAISHLDMISKEAELIGAVNTIKNEGGKLIGYNTDGRGFIRSLKEEGFQLQGKNVLVIGAGGAARAVSFQLALEGVEKLYISNRTWTKAENLAEEICDKLDLKGVQSLPLKTNVLKKMIPDLDLLVDTTPVGMHPVSDDIEPVINSDLLHSNLIVADLVYNPVETVLLKEAKKSGASTVSGLGMLAHQGAMAFEIWTDKAAPVKTMKNIIWNHLEKIE